MDSDAARLVEALQARQRTLALAESLTGGMVGSLLTTVPGAGDVFRGGIVAYVDDVKRDVLRVNPGLLHERGAVTAECARQMARGARELLHADVAVSTTGLAGPSAPEGLPVGLVFVGVSTREAEASHEFHFDGDREAVRRQSAEAALRLAYEAVVGKGP